jgi:hypothetical protein
MNHGFVALAASWCCRNGDDGYVENIRHIGVFMFDGFGGGKKYERTHDV